MTPQLSLSALLAEIDEAIQYRFTGETFWITAEITDVKKMPDKRWCFLKFVEKKDGYIVAEMKGVFWGNSYVHIEQFEKITKQQFANGLEITCEVRIRFHARYGLDVEVLAIDTAYTLGKVVLEKELTLQKLVQENPTIIRLVDEQYYTYNQQLQLPAVIQRIALVAAPNSDGYRDFVQECTTNNYCYAFAITTFATQVQGEYAAATMLQQLQDIATKIQHFDAVVIVRGGGSQLDFGPFDDYALAKCIAGFGLPIFTGIGHDSNTSIADMMARQLKTPTKVAVQIVDHNFYFENELLLLQDRMQQSVKTRLQDAATQLQQYNKTIKAYSPETILAKGYAIIHHQSKIVTSAAQLQADDVITIQLNTQKIDAIIYEKK
jgi:exodeoxyribonuclease VII large subunit